MRRVGLIGCGGIVQRTHARGYAAVREAGTGAVVALADVSEANREGAGGLFGVPPEQRYADYRDLLARAPVDTVAIATPHALHVEQAVGAAEAGKAIIAEKPMAVDPEGGAAIAAAVERRGVPYAVVHNLLWAAPVRAALALIAGGAIGEPLLARGEMLGFKDAGATRPELDWRASRAMGGGALIDSSYHELYTVEALLGSPIRSVQARLAALKLNPGHPDGVEDTALLLLEHANGRLSTVSASWCARSLPGGRWATAHGALGAVRVLYGAPHPLSVHRGAGWQEPDPESLVDGAIAGDSTGHAALLRETVRALDAGEPPPVGLAAARHTLAVIDAARRSSATGRAVEVAP